MIIKSHIRAGYRAAADYLKEQGKNEKIRLVEISDPMARNLDEAFQNMWVLASATKVKKPLHHISINPYKDERLTDKQVLRIVKRCEEKYGYGPRDHQRVIVEHIKDGRQHFHVIWCRVSLHTGKAIWPGHHWNKSKQAAREMEQELGLRRPMPRRMQRTITALAYVGRGAKYLGRYQLLNLSANSDLPYPKVSKGKTGKGDGAGGGAAASSSALKSSRHLPPIKKPTRNKDSNSSGPERRRKSIWVPVERRSHKPK